MPVLTVEGTYREGKVELAETPDGIREARVLVTFLPEQETGARNKEALRQRFLARLRRGVDFGTQPLPTREELYAERIDRFR